MPYMSHRMPACPSLRPLPADWSTSARLTCVWLTVVACVQVGSLAAASAQPGPAPSASAPAATGTAATTAAAESPQDRALSVAKAARATYAGGDFPAASAGFLAAYKLDPRPEFLYNAARAEQRALRLARAEALFVRVLTSRSSNTTMLARAGRHLAEVRKLAGALKRARAQGRQDAHDQARAAAAAEARRGAAKEPLLAVPRNPAAGPRPIASRAFVRRPASRTAWWATAGLGVAVAAAGGYLLVSAAAEQTTLDRRTAGDGPIVGYAYERYVSDQQRIWTRRRWGAITAGVGVAALLYGGYRLLGTPAPTTALVVLPLANGLLVRF